MAVHLSRLIYQFYLFVPSVCVLHPLLLLNFNSNHPSNIHHILSFPPILHILHILRLRLRGSLVQFARFDIDLDLCCFTMDSVLYFFNSVIRWIRLKIYQYEVTFAVYMLTPTEKFIFSMSAC